MEGLLPTGLPCLGMKKPKTEIKVAKPENTCSYKRDSSNAAFQLWLVYFNITTTFRGGCVKLSPPLLVSASEGENTVDPWCGHLGYVYYNTVCGLIILDLYWVIPCQTTGTYKPTKNNFFLIIYNMPNFLLKTFNI